MTTAAAVLPLIAEPAHYRPSTIDLIHDAQARDHWINVFLQHIAGMAKLAMTSRGNTPQAIADADQWTKEFTNFLQDYFEDAQAHGPASILYFCEVRQELLEKYHFADPYLAIKQQENAAALQLLPELLRELDALDEQMRLRSLIENIFAGNIFDLGCANTIALYETGQADFHAVRARLPARPWCVDDFDALEKRFDKFAYRKALLFVDNSGADVVLGMLPLARELLRRGSQVILTANSKPALNDITHAELIELLDRIAEWDSTFRTAMQQGQLQLIASGNGVPEIDLSRVSSQLAREAADVDFLVLEGMGRSLETNYRTRFTVDTLKIAMIKEKHVAQTLGGKMYGVVCRFETGTKYTHPE